MNPYDKSAYLFCNKKRNSIKILCYDKNGFVLAQKTLLDADKMKFQWPRNSREVRLITKQQLQLELLINYFSFFNTYLSFKFYHCILKMVSPYTTKIIKNPILAPNIISAYDFFLLSILFSSIKSAKNNASVKTKTFLVLKPIKVSKAEVKADCPLGINAFFPSSFFLVVAYAIIAIITIDVKIIPNIIS